MDNLVSQGTGVSRLSFTQKVIASGMSVILALGLSPLGQVSAYADDGGAGTVAAQSADLQAQATQPTEDNSLTSVFKLEVSDVYYDTEAWFDADVTAENEAATNRVIGNIVDISKVDDKGVFKPLDYSEKTEESDPKWVWDADSSVYKWCEDGEKATWTLEFQDVAGKKIKDSGEIRDAGTYKVVMKGGVGYKDKTATATFEVKPYDFKNVVPDAENDALNPVKMSYNGKVQTIHYVAGEYGTVQGAYPVLRGKNPNNPDDDKATVEIKLDEKSVRFTPGTLNEAGDKVPVTVNGTGNYTGTLTTTADMAKAILTVGTAGLVKVNGSTNEYDEDKQPGSKVDKIDLAQAKKSPTVADPDPANPT